MIQRRSIPCRRHVSWSARFCTPLLLVLAACSEDGASGGVGPPDTPQAPGRPRPMTTLDANRVTLPFDNTGRIHDAVGANGLFRNDRDYYVFGAGFALAAVMEGVPLAAYGYDPASSGSTFNQVSATDLAIVSNYPVLSAPAAPGEEEFATFEPAADEEVRVVLAQSRSSALNGQGLSLLAFQRGFAFDEPDLQNGVLLRLDAVLQPGGAATRAWGGLLLDPDIGFPHDDARAWLNVDGEQVMVIWDTDLFDQDFLVNPPAILLQVVYSHEGGSALAREHHKYQPPLEGAERVLGLLDGSINEYFNAYQAEIYSLVATPLPDWSPGDIRSVGAALIFVPVPEGVLPADLNRNGQTGELVASEAVVTAIGAAARAFRDAYRSRIQPLPALGLEDFPGAARTASP